MTEFHPFLLSQELAKVAARLGRAPVASEPTRVGPSSFGTSTFPGRTAFELVRGLPEDEPLRGPLLSWLVVLIDARVGEPEDAELARLALEVRAPSLLLGREVSLRDLSLAALTARGERRHSLWLDRLVQGRALGERRLARCETTREVLRLLGVNEPVGAHHPPTPPELDRLAEGCLGRAARFGETDESLGGWIDARLAVDAAEGWPARLTEDTTLDLLGLRTLAGRLGARVGGVPERFAPSSFALSFRRVGVALRRTRLDRGLPFVLVEDPFGFAESVAGDFFGLLPIAPIFHRRRLGLGRDASEANARAFLRAVGRELDRRALDMLVDREVSAGRRAADERTREATNAWFGRALEAREWASLFPIRASAAHSFAALGVALAEFERAIELDDEDFLESPRFQERLLAEFGRVPGAVDANVVERGFAYFERQLARIS